LAVSGQGSVRTLTVEKQRDGEAGLALCFRTELDQNEVLRVRAVEALSGRTINARDRDIALAALQDLGPGEREITDWRNAAYAAFGDRTANALKQALHKAKGALIDAGRISVVGTKVSVTIG
jgi:hypothetical protein